jgi:carbamoyl-phosphate synthase large subunit
MTEQITALVTAVGGIGVGEQILKALVLVGGYRLVACDLDGRTPQFALADASEVLPEAGDPSYLYELFDACERHDVDVVFIGSEAELTVVSEVREQFANAGILVAINLASTVRTCSDKNLTSQFLAAHGFATPRHVVVARHHDCDGIDWFPVVVKPCRNGRGSRDCYVAQDQLQLHSLLDYLAPREAAVMVQEYVGDADSEYTVGVLHDLDGNFLNSIAVHRRLDLQLSIRQSVRNESGKRDLGDRLIISSGVTQGTVGTFPEVTGTCEAIARALDARGPVNVQCRLVDGEVVVFEINPRFSGTTSLRAMVGYNEPDVLIRRHLLGESVPERFPYRPAMIVRSLREWVVPAQAPMSSSSPDARTAGRGSAPVLTVAGAGPIGAAGDDPRPGDGTGSVQDPSPGA